MENRNYGGVLANVIGIIAVCILTVAFLISIFALIKEPPYTRGLCLRNLNECATAIRMYMDDNNEYLPSSALVRHSKKWSKRDFLTFATEYGEIPPSANNRITWPQIAYDYMKIKTRFFCPLDTTPQDNPHAKVSYWWKLAIDKAWYGEGCTKAYRKFDDYTYNSDQVILYDRYNWHYPETGSIKTGAHINVVFLDTHVRTIKIRNATSGDPVNCAANSDGEPMYFNYDMKKYAPLADNKTPAKFVDPGRYSDDYSWPWRQAY